MDIMNTVVTKLNQKMIREKRKILLLMDNVSSHSPDLKDSFSNVKSSVPSCEYHFSFTAIGCWDNKGPLLKTVVQVHFSQSERRK